MVINSFIYLGCASFIAVYGLSLVAASRSYSAVAVHGFLIAVASLVAEHGLYAGAPELRLSRCDARTQLSCGVWDLPRLGIEPMSPALAGEFLTAGPPGKS